MYKGVVIGFRYKGIFGLSEWVGTVSDVIIIHNVTSVKHVTKDNVVKLLLEGCFKSTGHDLRVMSADGIWYDLNEIQFV